MEQTANPNRRKRRLRPLAALLGTTAVVAPASADVVATDALGPDAALLSAVSSDETSDWTAVLPLAAGVVVLPSDPPAASLPAPLVVWLIRSLTS